MGIVRMGAPIELIEKLVNKFNIHNFIETGTYQGNTAFLASQIFNQVITIEFSRELYQQAQNKYQSVKNITFLFGDTRTELTKIIANLNNTALFWLDAHWSGGLTYGQQDECPLIEEIEIINIAISTLMRYTIFRF